MNSFEIRVFGDPVLKKVAKEVEEIDEDLLSTCDRMLKAMYEAPGIGLAAPQVGISKRFFVWVAIVLVSFLSCRLLLENFRRQR